MAVEWKKKKISMICDSISCPAKIVCDEVILINTSDVSDGKVLNHQKTKNDSLKGQFKKLFKENDILFSEIRPKNRRFAFIDFTPSNYIASTKLMVLRSKSNIDPKFLYHYITSDIIIDFLQSIAETRSGTFPQITFSELANIEIPIPPLDEQKRIAGILSAFDDKIELNRKMCKTLEAMAQTLFQSWFVNFDPVKAKIAALESGADPELAAMMTISGKTQAELAAMRTAHPQAYADLAHTAGLFPAAMTDTELGKIPEGWCVGKISDIANVVGGGTPSTKESSFFSLNGIPWLTPKDLSNFEGKYIIRGAIDITENGLKNSSAHLLPPGAILFSSRAPIGYIAIANNNVCTSQGFKSLIPKNDVLGEYLYQLLKHNTKKLESIATGATFKEISGNAMKTFHIIIPDSELLLKYAQKTFHWDVTFKRIYQQCLNLTTQRNLLLKKLFNTIE